MMRADIELAGGALSFAEPTDPLAPFPYLEEIGSLHMSAKVGETGSGETPSMSITLRNDRGRVAGMLGSPLRARVTVYDGSDVYFVGIVSAVALGRTVVLTLEA